MYRAKTIFSTLAPLAGERYISWIARSSPSTRINQIFAVYDRKYSSHAATEPFLNGSSSSYVEEMYNAWLQDPHSVHVVCKYNNLEDSN